MAPAAARSPASPAPATSAFEDLKEIKLNLPRRQHILLHQLKVLHGKTMSEIVTDALSQYFERAGAKLGEA